MAISGGIRKLPLSACRSGLDARQGVPFGDYRASRRAGTAGVVEAFVDQLTIAGVAMRVCGPGGDSCDRVTIFSGWPERFGGGSMIRVA